VLLFLDGCSKRYVSVVFLTGQVLGNWIAYGSWPDRGNHQCLVMGISWSRDPQGFQHFAGYRKSFAILTLMVDASCLIEMMAHPISNVRALASPRRIDDMLWYILMMLIGSG
jgi:hypothetical protein